jgi:hypothetical protein
VEAARNITPNQQMHLIAAAGLDAEIFRVPARMSLLQQLRSIIIHGFRLAFFLPANRNAFDGRKGHRRSTTRLETSIQASAVRHSTIAPPP